MRIINIPWILKGYKFCEESRCMMKSNVSYLNFAGTRFRCLCSCMSVLFKADNIIIYRCRVSLTPVFLPALFLLFSSRQRKRKRLQEMLATSMMTRSPLGICSSDMKPPPSNSPPGSMQAWYKTQGRRAFSQCSPILTSTIENSHFHIKLGHFCTNFVDKCANFQFQ